MRNGVAREGTHASRQEHQLAVGPWSRPRIPTGKLPGQVELVREPVHVVAGAQEREAQLGDGVAHRRTRRPELVVQATSEEQPQLLGRERSKRVVGFGRGEGEPELGWRRRACSTGEDEAPRPAASDGGQHGLGALVVIVGVERPPVEGEAVVDALARDGHAGELQLAGAQPELRLEQPTRARDMGHAVLLAGPAAIRTGKLRPVNGRAIGLRVKLGWAMAVVVGADGAGGPAVLARDELRFAAADGAFAYHAAMDAERSERDAVVAREAARAADAATNLLADACERHGAATVGLVVGRGVRRLPTERILASSQLFHTADAEVLQDGFTEAARRLSLPLVRVTFAAAEADEAWNAISALGKSAGKPWRKDEKLATTAAWAALRATGRGSFQPT